MESFVNNKREDICKILNYIKLKREKDFKFFFVRIYVPNHRSEINVTVRPISCVKMTNSEITKLN